MLQNVLIGHDAEVFVYKNGVLSSAIGLIGGTKEVPLPVHDGALQEDNVLAELNITPCMTEKQFIGRTNSVLTQLSSLLPEGYEYMVESSNHYEREALLAFGEKAMEFGCTPDFNCWTLEENEVGSPYTTLRTAGGHIHIGFDDVTSEKQVAAARMAEYLLGLPSVVLDDDKQRRDLYGSSGAYRPKPYGVEYRVMSNFWLRNERLMGWAFKQAMLCADIDKLDGMTAVVTPAELSSIINHGDVERAKLAIRDLKIQMP